MYPILIRGSTVYIETHYIATYLVGQSYRFSLFCGCIGRGYSFVRGMNSSLFFLFFIYTVKENYPSLHGCIQDMTEGGGEQNDLYGGQLSPIIID